MPYVGALLRYFVIAVAILGLAWASVTVKIGDKTAAAHVRERGRGWLAELTAEDPPKKPAPKKATKAPSRRAVAKKKAPAKKDSRPVREVPPEELQAEPEAAERVNMLAEAARRADRRIAEKKKPEPTRITADQKKALDALLSNRQSP